MGAALDRRSEGRAGRPWEAPRFLAGLAALAVTILSATAATAQQSLPYPFGPASQIPTPAAAQADPRPFQLRSFLRLEGEYNDNFFLSETNKQEEFREILTPGLGFRLSSGASFADLLYAPSLVHSSLNEGEVELFHFLDANATLALSERTTLNGTERFRRTDLPAITDPRGIRRDRAVLVQNTLSSNLTYRQDPWSLVPRYSLTINQNEGGARTQSGNQTATTNQERSVVHALATDATLDILGRNTLGAGYELTLADFKIANDFTGHTGRFSLSRELNPLTRASLGGFVSYRDVKEPGIDFNIYSADIGLRRDVSPLYTLEARFGYNITDAVTGAGDSKGFTFRLEGTYTGKLVRFSAVSGQSIQETFLDRDNVGLIETRDSTMQLQYDASSWLTLSLTGRVAQNRFLQSSGVSGSGQAQDRKDFLVDLGCDLSFQLTRLLFLTVGYAYGTADSNLAGLDYQNNRVRVGLTVTYP